ncbi:MAG: ATP-dependent RNA helicase HrpA [Pseudomonadota bacterium]
MSSNIKSLRDQIPQCMLRDQPAFTKRLRQIEQRRKQNLPHDKSLTQLEQDLAQSRARCETRRNNLPKPVYPEQLPVCERRESIKEVLAAHPVVIVAGETGSGKTTQLPKICLELGRGAAGMIGHTQPRRIAARTLATRIASELQSEVGHAVGYKIRFSDRVGTDTYIKVLTDGMLLAESQGDRWLQDYDTLIIDEAHERSLNIDFLLGYIKELLPRRPDLKVIITSATIDTERFSKHFHDAPIIEVSGRTYPVEVRYRPLVEDGEEGETDLMQGLLAAIDEIATLDRHGHILVFLPGEREIREAAEALRKHHPANSEVLPLYARLSASEQNKIFQPSARQRIVLSTNVAETSLTVPGIRYVIDTGVARISRYSFRSKVQRLPIERISQASANQRKGRCGRVGPGVCIRLYSEEDFLSRPLFTEPEILRTNLASVILQMTALGLGDIAAFPFIEPPDSRMINDGYKLLQELGAVDDRYQITEAGRRLARLPVDPRLGCMLLAAVQERALTEVLIIVAAMSIQDPRERPADYQQAADEAHREFQDEDSDFIGYVKLWRWFQEQKHHLSRNKLRALCKSRFISYLRMLEWEDIHHQLKNQMTEFDARFNELPAEYPQIHRALLRGLLSHLGMKLEDKEYLGARNKKFRIFPGSGLYKKPPKWVMAAELVETAQLYARGVARIEPEWVEQAAGHLCKRSYSEPRWEKKSAQVVADEKLTLYGLPIVAQRKASFGRIDPKTAREIFIREALVHGDFHTRAEFFEHNRRLIIEVEEIEHKARRRDVLIDEQQLYDFYDSSLPETVVSGRDFENWYREQAKQQPKLLFLDKDALMSRSAAAVTSDMFPDFISHQGIKIALQYHFDPSHKADGVTAIIPLAALNQLRPEPFEWLVPGLLQEKIIYLIKALPKSIRRNFVPAPNYAAACMGALSPSDASLLEALAKQLGKMSGIALSTQDWQELSLPTHLLMNFEIIDPKGKMIAEGRDLEILQARFGEKARSVFNAKPDSGLEKTGLTNWDFGDLPASIEIRQHGLSIQGFPTLIDRQTSVELRVVDSVERSRTEMRHGLRRLIMLQLPDKIKYLHKNLMNINKICLMYAPLGQCEALKEEIIALAIDEVFFPEGQGEIRSQAAFLAVLQQGREQLIVKANEISQLIGQILTQYTVLKKSLKGGMPPLWMPAVNDIRQQIDGLVRPGFVAQTPLKWLKHLPRYLKAAELRLEKLPSALERDRQNAAEIARLWQLLQRKSKPREIREMANSEPRWMIEELRVSLFSQELKTAFPVSVKRMEKMLEELG